MTTVREAAVGWDAREYFVFRLPFIRGACILAVIGTHVSSAAVGFISFCVPVFVLLSGFHLSLNPRNERPVPFYRRTLKFLVVPYVVYSCLYAIPHVVRGATARELWLRFLASDIERHLWFMPVIIALYLLHPWLRRLYLQHPAATCFAAFAVQLLAWPWLKTHGLPEGAATTLLSFSAQIGYFVVGYVVVDEVGRVREFCERPAARALGAAAWLLWPTLHLWYNPSGPAAVAGRLLAVLSYLAAFCVLASIGRPLFPLGRSVAAWIARVGLYSYGMYLVHPLVISVVSRAIAPFTAVPSGGLRWSLVVFCVTAPVTLLVARSLARLSWGRYLV